MGLRKRQEAAFESLYSRHVRDVYGYALGVLGSSADAEDVTQTTFLNAYRALEGGKRPHSPRSWLFAIAHNVCRQRFRQAARRPREVELHDAYAVEEGTDAPSASDIARALQSLPFTQRSALVMRELEGRSQAEIADALGASVSAVETLLFRARRGMRDQLESSLTCGEAARAISRQLDGASSRAERGALRAHLRVCEECATFARRARARSGAMRRVGGALPLPAGLMTWTLGGGGVAVPAGGVGLKVLAGAAAVVMAAGATEQVVVHHDPPPARAAAVRTAPPATAARADVAVVKPAAVNATPQATLLAERRHGAAVVEARERRHRVAGAKSRGQANAAERKAHRAGGSRHAASQRGGAGSSRGATSRSAAAQGRSAGSSRGAVSRSGAAQRGGAGSSRGATSRSGASQRSATSRSGASQRTATSPAGASQRTATSPAGASERGATSRAAASPRRTTPATSTRRSTKSAASRQSATSRQSAAARSSATSRSSATWRQSAAARHSATARRSASARGADTAAPRARTA